MQNKTDQTTQPEPTRVLIPPPPTVPKVEIPHSSAVIVSPHTTTELQKLDISKQSKFINCNLCKATVHADYLDQHSKIHIMNYSPMKSAGTTSNGTSQSIVRLSDNISSSITTTTDKPKLDEKHEFKFRRLEQACVASTVSKTGRYSDFTIVFWEEEKDVAFSGRHVGAHSTYTAKDWQRFQIHIVHDSLEDYYTVSCKLLKRSGYSAYDNEDSIPDRICNQEELGTEIKRALLFFSISPKGAMKHFLRLFQQELVIDYDKDGRACIVRTKNCEELNARLNKKQSYEYHGYGC